MRKQTKNQTKTPAAPKPAKTKGEAAPPVVLPALPPNCAAALVPLLAAAALDLPNARREGNAARFVALLDEWEAFAATPEAQVETTVVENGAEYSTGETPASRAFDALEAGPFREDPRAYYAAEVAQLSRRAILAARRVLEPLDAAAAAAVCSACARLFDALGPLVREYREAWPYEGRLPFGPLNFRHDLRLKISARLDDALAALAECARNPPPVAGEPATPTADAVRELGAKVEAAAAATREAVRAVGAPVSALVEERRNADADDVAVRETQKREAFEAWAHGFDFATPGGASARRASFVMFCGGKEGAAYCGVPRILNAEEFERLCQNKMRNLRR